MDVKEFFAGLTSTLEAAVAKGDADIKKGEDEKDKQPGFKAELDGLTERISGLEKVLSAEEGLSYRTIVTKLNADIEAVREALGLVADSVRKMVDATAVRKSVAGDDSKGKGNGDGDDVEKDPEKVQKAADAALEEGVAGLIKRPVGSSLELG